MIPGMRILPVSLVVVFCLYPGSGLAQLSVAEGTYTVRSV
jgi:hypothetical protein